MADDTAEYSPEERKVLETFLADRSWISVSYWKLPREVGPG